uniref:Uncharacterized protein n=1 Tax=Leptocylindrus danicus TaxID=163516 RepID=A0A7S2P2M0_9STRA
MTKAIALPKTDYDNSNSTINTTESLAGETSYSGDKLQKSVSFTKLEIRQYELQLGDNPSVRKGPPISIGWDIINSSEHDLETYEGSRGLRRSYEQLKINDADRKEMLKEAGYSWNEVRSRMRQNNIIKRKRLNTATSTTFVEKMSERYQSFKRCIKKVVFRKKRREELLWKEMTLRYADEDSNRYRNYARAKAFVRTELDITHRGVSTEV